MLISLDWIKEFVKLPDIDADDLANTFTLTTAEVENVKKVNDHLTQIKVAEIKSIKKHPEADKLNLVTFDYGAGETKEVVCGAPNVREGLKVPYAPIGLTLPNGLTLEPKKIRGILSEGMLCSEVELGLGEGKSGLMELADSTPLGQTMLEYSETKQDIIIDVDNKSLTHRPDLWGHYGLAREFAAAYEVPLADKFNADWKKSLESKFTNDSSPITPKVESDSSCLAYWGLSLDGVKVGESPLWLKQRLEAVGLRAINNIVDISNYVMMELGFPLHIFDRSKIKDNTIHIKRVGKEDTFETLDEIKRSLIPSDTVICDSEKPLVLAGIMGGHNSGVDENTKSIFIEVANWKAEEVRMTSTRLGLRTDSSSRYEKSLDSLQCYQTLLRTLELVTEFCPEAKVIGKAEYDGSDLSKIEELTIKTSYNRIRKTLGHNVEDSSIKSIFESLAFKVDGAGDDINVTIPTFRTTKDIEYEADLIEEIGRVIGYDNIEPVSPLTDIKATRLDHAKALGRKIQDFLTLNASSLEVMTYPLIGEKLLEKALWNHKNEELKLVNALSTDADRMRPSLLPHALNTVGMNAKQFSSFKFFELGRSYHYDEKNFANEKHELLIGFFNKKSSPILDLINTVEDLFNYCGINYNFANETGKFKNEVVSDWEGLHPHEQTHLRVMGKFKGIVASAHPLVLRNFKVKGHFSFAVIDLTELMAREIKSKNKYEPIPKFPGSTFDCTVLVKKSENLANVVEVARKIKIKEMKDVKVVDTFDLDDENYALTLQASFMDPNKTLDSDFIKNSEEKIVKTLSDAGYPLKA